MKRRLAKISEHCQAALSRNTDAVWDVDVPVLMRFGPYEVSTSRGSGVSDFSICDCRMSIGSSVTQIRIGNRQSREPTRYREVY